MPKISNNQTLGLLQNNVLGFLSAAKSHFKLAVKIAANSCKLKRLVFGPVATF
jgi:hypothetical protein